MRRLLVTALFLLGCPPSRSARDAAAELDSDDVRVRREAADDIEHIAKCDGELPRDVLEKMIDRYAVEKDPDVRADLLDGLVLTGDDSVEPLLDYHLLTSDYDEQRQRAELYQRWASRSDRGYTGEDVDEQWPYGTRGHPPAVHGGTVWIPDAPAPRKFTARVEIGSTWRRLYETSVYGFDLDTMLGARTRAGIWGLRLGMVQGATEAGRHAWQLRLGPMWEAPTEHVRPSLMLRLGYMRFAQFTNSTGDGAATLLAGVHVGLTVDLWRHEYDHAVYLHVAGGIDGWFDGFALPGAAFGAGARY
jgi:hypothetical protein